MSKIVKTTLAEAMAKPISARQKAALERFKKEGDNAIDYSDIPAFTDEELSKFKRAVHGGTRAGAGRKPAGTKQVSLWLHEKTITKMVAFAEKEGTTLSAAFENHLVWR